jgi:nucleotide-binding universal stress UspA family protein
MPAAKHRLVAAFVHGLSVTLEVDWGGTAQRIVDETGEHDLIVLAARHHRCLARFVHGHVVEHVLHHADVPLLVVPVLQGSAEG